MRAAGAGRSVFGVGSKDDHRLASGVGQFLLAAIAIGLFLTLPLPSLDLPSVEVPDLPDLPWWLAPVLKWAKIVVPITVGVLVVLGELKKRGKGS
jgi:hypothetical protein